MTIPDHIRNAIMNVGMVREARTSCALDGDTQDGSCPPNIFGVGCVRCGSACGWSVEQDKYLCPRCDRAENPSTKEK